MQQDNDINLVGRKVTARLLIKRCQTRGWKVSAFEAAGGLLLVTPPGHHKPLKIYSSTPPQTSRAASMMADNKFITSTLLKEAGLPTPIEMLVDAKAIDKNDQLDEFLGKYGQVVVKPLDAAHGNGVTLNVCTAQQLRDAILGAARYVNSGMVLIQKQLSGIDVRVVCIDYQFANAISRLPARVIGDGQHSVEQLIAITNASSERGENYSAKLNKIPLDRVRNYLERTALQSIPHVGESVQVLGVANIGAGGELENITARTPLFLQQLAVKASQALDLPVAGIDFMMTRVPTIQDDKAVLNPVIIEANASPMLAMYEDQESAEQVALIDTYLDFVAKA